MQIFKISDTLGLQLRSYLYEDFWASYFEHWGTCNWSGVPNSRNHKFRVAQSSIVITTDHYQKYHAHLNCSYVIRGKRNLRPLNVYSWIMSSWPFARTFALVICMLHILAVKGWYKLCRVQFWSLAERQPHLPPSKATSIGSDLSYYCSDSLLHHIINLRPCVASIVND